MPQTGLIESIMQDVGISPTSSQLFTLSDSTLQHELLIVLREDCWNYQSVIRKLSFFT
jgi:hypothetical protein